MIPIVGVGFLVISASGSFFSDLERSLGNIFQAAESYAPPTPTPPPIAQTLVINEVLPQSTCKVGNSYAQWIEIYNGFSYPVDLKNYRITDANGTLIDLVTSNTTIPSKSLALISHDNSLWNKCYTDNGVITANFGGTLDLNTGTLKLYDNASPTPNILDTVIWGASPNPTPNIDESIERDPDGKDTKLGNDFEPSDFVIRAIPLPGL